MKRLTIILTMTMLCLLLATGCTTSHRPDEPAPPEPGSPSSIITNPPLVAGATFAVAPAYLELGNLYPGAEVSTWTGDGYLDLAGSRVHYTKGDPVCIAIYNGQNYTVSYKIAVEDAPLEINQCNTIGKEFYMAPSGFIPVVEVSDNSPTLSPYEIKTIPFSFVLPIGTDYPEMWEFRIVIIEQGIQIARGYGIRVFITMR